MPPAISTLNPLLQNPVLSLILAPIPQYQLRIRDSLPLQILVYALYKVLPQRADIRFHALKLPLHSLGLFDVSFLRFAKGILRFFPFIEGIREQRDDK